MLITPVIGMIHITKGHHWIYKGKGLWMCLVSPNKPNSGGWQVGETYRDAAPFTPDKSDRIIWPFKIYLQLCER